MSAARMQHRPPVVINNLTEYMRAISNLDVDDNLLLRGQRKGSWPLIPSVARLVLQRDKTVLGVERKLLHDFRAACLPFIEVAGKDSYDLLAIGQHHGLATRLLDWTGNPLAAMWFAVKDPALEGSPGLVTAFVPTDSDYVDPERDTDPFNLPKTRFFKPSHLNARIVAQNGWFSVHKWNVKSNKFSDVGKLSAYASRIHRFEVPADQFWLLRRELDRMGFNDATMFPGLDGITRNLNWAYSLLPDETKPMQV